MRDYFMARATIMNEILKNDGFNGVMGFHVSLAENLVDSTEKREIICSELQKSPIVKNVVVSKNGVLIDFATLSANELNDYYMQFSYFRDKNYPNDYIFDENRSVKWNREEVQKINDMIKRIKIAERHFINIVDKEIACCNIKEARERYNLDLGYPTVALMTVWNKAYEEYHSYGYNDVKNGFFEYLEMCLDFLKLCK